MGEPKSAYELAMERLRKKDQEAGIEQVSLTDEQKTEIGEVRRTYDARLAQEEIMHKSAMMRTIDPAARATLEDEYRRTRARLNDERDAKIEKIRRAAGQGAGD
jgi:LPS O-antigen subunit length determinant protein (WzzB/FepE family)